MSSIDKADLPLKRKIARFQGQLFVALPSAQGPDYVRLGKRLDAKDTSRIGAHSDRDTGALARDVLIDELDEYFRIKATFTWRDATFDVNFFKDDGSMSASPVGRDARWARENGLHVIDFAWSVGGFHPSEVDNLTRTTTDLLAKRKEENQ